MIRSVLGRGTHSVVYAVEDVEDPGEALALKMATVGDGTPQNDRYREEFNVARQIRHPNIARVFHFEASRSGSQPYLVMERIAGRDFLQATDGVGIKAFCKLAAQLCRALLFLHRRGYAHGDLKPSNTMVSGGDGRLVLKLLDLGLAWEPHETRSGEARGTLHYMAPEMLSGAPIDFRSDLYSVGVILFEALAGRKPFAAQGEDLLAEIRSVTPSPPAHPRLPAPPALWEVVLRLLEKAPGARPSSAAETITALADAVGLALPVETPETAQAYVRSVPFAGRAVLLSEWASRLASLGTRRTSGTLFAVSGGWGSGKTRLLEELADRARMRGVATLEIRGSILDRGDNAGPQRVFDRAWRMAENQPCALLVDDAHCLSAEALQALAGVLRVSKRRALLVACTFSQEMAGPGGGARLLADCGDGSALPTSGLAPLAEAETASLVKYALPGQLNRDLASQVHRRTQGNPLFLVETLSSLVLSQTPALSCSGTVASIGDLAGLGADSLSALIDERLAALEEGLQVLRACAVMGQPLSQSLIADLIGCLPSEVPGLVVRFEQLGLAHRWRVSSQGGVAIVQATIARRVREALTDGEEAEIHRRLAETIERGLEDSSQYGLSRIDALSAVAENFAAAEDLDKAGPYAMQAAVEYAAEARAERTVHFARLALRAPGCCQLDRQRMFEALGDALLHLGKGKEAAEAFAEATGCVDTLDDELTLVRLQRKSAQTLRLCRRPREALSLLEAARARAAAWGPSEEKSRLECAIGEILVASRKWAQALPHLEVARELAQASGSALAEAEADRILGVGLTYMKRHDDARACLERARSLFRASNDEPKYAAATFGLAFTLKELGQLGRAEQLYRDAIVVLEEIGSADTLAKACNHLAALHHMQYDWASARRFYERSIQIQERLGVSAALGWSNLAIVASAASQLGAALQAVREAVRSAQESDSLTHADAVVRLAYTWHHIGGLEQAEEATRRAHELLRTRDDIRIRNAIHLVVGHCHRLRGRYGPASEEYDLALHAARERQVSSRIQNALTHLACLRLLEGKPEEARTVAQEALDAGEPDPDMVEVAFAQTQYGRTLHALGRSDEAVDVLAHAYVTMERANAPLWRAEVAGALAAVYLDKGEMAYFSHYITDCLDAFDIATADLQDDGLVETFLQDPRRREVFDMIEKAKDQHGL